jgi:phosphopantetheinyl transferase (holo-ACP synthase)
VGVDLIPGNDVVDLAKAHSAFSERFLKKVFAPEEEAAIRKAPDARLNAWAHWAAKESAFKVLSRRDPDLPFHWKRFVVFLAASMQEGYVQHPAGMVQFKAEVTAEYVHVLAGFSSIPEGVVSAIDPHMDQSEAVRQLACEFFTRLKGKPAIVERENDLPVLVSEKKRHLVSLSHHGRFVAVAFFL